MNIEQQIKVGLHVRPTKNRDNLVFLEKIMHFFHFHSNSEGKDFCIENRKTHSFLSSHRETKQGRLNFQKSFHPKPLIPSPFPCSKHTIRENEMLLPSWFFD